MKSHGLMVGGTFMYKRLRKNPTWFRILALTVAAIQFTQVKLSLAGKKVEKKDVVLEKKK